MKRITTIGLYFIVSVAAVGCIAVGGSDRYEAKEPTLGKQLQDLKMARDNGAISQDEYDRARSNMLAKTH